MKYRFFQIAKRLSYKSDYAAHRLGCVIVNGTTIKGLGFNKNRTHPKSNNQWKTTHAELSAILNAGTENLYGCEAYIYRETKNGNIAMARPCSFCTQLLRSVGINKIHYSDYNGYKTEEL